MNIALATSWLSTKTGGIFNVVRNTGHSLETIANTRVRVFGLDKDLTPADLQAWAPVEVERLRPVGPFVFGYLPGMVSALLAWDADLVHSHGLWKYTSVAALRWTRKSRRPHVVTPHGMLDAWALRQWSLRKRLTGVAFERANLNEAACVHALCIPEAASIRRYGARAPICVIPNGVDLPASGTIDRSMLSAEQERKTVLFLGRIHPKKGLTQFLRGWAEARRSSPSMAANWSVVIAGWSEFGHQDELKKLANDLGIADDVQFPGPLLGDQKMAALQSATAFVLPSLSEGIPMGVLEAWGYELPVLMTPECNLTQAYAMNAALELRSDASSIATALLRLCEMSDGERRKIGVAGRRLVEERYTWAHVVQQLASVYRWILGGGAKPDSVL
jgi:poly(glycerol-phosphate) alpha-glucosyltransferase